jgi:ribosomal protein L7/L12
MSYGSQPIYFHSYSAWGWFDQETHLPSYYKTQYIEYAAPRYSEKPSSYKDQFDQNRSGAQAKKKVVKQVYHMKYDGRKDKSSDLNSTIEKPIKLLKTSANDGKEVEKSSIDVVCAKFEQKKMKVPKIKKELPLSKIEAKPTCSIGLPKWQEKKLQKLNAEKLKEKGLAWVPKRRIQAQKDDAQASVATKAKERRRFKKQLPSWRFAPNHQNHWSWHHPYSLPMPIWNSSPGMHGYPSAPYFDPWYGSICFRGLPNYFAYQ